MPEVSASVGNYYARRAGFADFAGCSLPMSDDASRAAPDRLRAFASPRCTVMQIKTTRFGSVQIDVEDILLFPHGVIGFGDCRHWVLLGDAENPALGWLQCVSREEVALPVVSPRPFAADYQVRVTRGQLAALELSQFDQAYVLSIVSKSDDELTLNLKAPLIVNLDRRLGRQVITCDEQPMAMPLSRPAAGQLRKSA